MIILDTNVLSEMTRPTSDVAVEAWLSAQLRVDVFISAITEAELRLGLTLMPSGKRRLALSALIEGILTKDFDERILPFDSQAAQAYAEIVANRRRAGKPISQSDAQIAAIVRSCGATLATRNVRDFADCGITVINPWTATRH